MPMTERDKRATLVNYTSGRITAIEARRRLGDIGFGDLLRLVADEGLALPQASATGREDKLRRARTWLFPEKAVTP